MLKRLFAGRSGRFELKQGKDGQWYFTLKAGNHKVVCQSEGYHEKRKALQGIKAIQKLAASAQVVETTPA